MLTVALDIEIEPFSHVIALVPRDEAKPTVEADPLDALGLAQVDAWRREALQALSGLEDDPLSPFVRETFEQILYQATALLDPNARYNSGTGGVHASPPNPGPELVISDAFGFFQRERRATQLMADLLAFRDLLDAGGEGLIIPPAIAALFTEPSGQAPSEDFPTFRGINSIAGVTSSDGCGEDLFFPKPFNAEQVQIIQRLAIRDGVVVQGPPGTGKTHTIADIISHYLATGRRILVTSQKSPALQVLQEQLPLAIRPLAVSLLDSDREGLKQFRASVDLIAERLQHMRRSEIEAEIAALETRIDGLHRTIASADRQMDRIGRDVLQAVELDGIRIEPVEAAREVLNAGTDALWIEDRIDARAAHDPQFSDDDIGLMREARRRVGNDLPYLGEPLPDPHLLIDPDVILSMQRDLVQAAAIGKDIASGALWPLADDEPETLLMAEKLEQQLVNWCSEQDELSASAATWDDVLSKLISAPGDPLLEALRSFDREATALSQDHAYFLSRPVDIPDGATDDARFMDAIGNLLKGGSGLGLVGGLFARKTKTNLAGIRLCGKPPTSADEWSDIDRFIKFTDRTAILIRSWRHACTNTGLPVPTANDPHAARAVRQVLDRLQALYQLNIERGALITALRDLMPRWSGRLGQGQEITNVLICLRAHIDRARLRSAERLRQTLTAKLGNAETEIHLAIGNMLAAVGNEALEQPALRETVLSHARRIRHLHDLMPAFCAITDICDKIEASGGAIWADRLSRESAGKLDNLCPGDWRKRWRLRRLLSWLDASDQSASLRALNREREQAEADLSKAYTSVIEQRTWLALKQQASPAVLSALAAYGVAVGKIGRGTGKSANRHRKSAQQAANAVKGALPCWIMPHHRVSESLPAELGIFDLVIVDEASQSTLASLPALFRAKQILVVGDDKQVSPDNVGLAMDQANALATRHLAKQVPMFIAPMRQEASLYDLASVIFGGDRLMLREHFRCAAPIIEFSRQQFYRGELRPLRLSKASERLDPVLIDVRVTDGYRKGRGKTNPPEADYIVEELRRIGDDPAFKGRSIGVTTLLGIEQAALIYRQVENELGIPFIEKFRFRVGDPAVFQGDERDIMFLSMVATPGNAAALSGLAYEQRFNVAASRARERMYLVRSIDMAQLSPRDELRRALLAHFYSPFPADAVDPGDARSRCESDFEREMFDALIEHGYYVDTQVRVGGHRIDMVVEGDNDCRLGIECDGDRYHGPEQWPSDMVRQRTLERAGWRIWRCFASRFVRERKSILSELFAMLEANGICPRRASERSRSYTEYREWPFEVVIEPEHMNQIADSTIINSDSDVVLQKIYLITVNQGNIEGFAESVAYQVGDPDYVEEAGDTASRTNEAQIQAAILHLMSDGAVWTNAQLKTAIPRIVSLSEGDRKRSSSRPKEEKWQELVNNALSRTGRSNSLYARGLVGKVGFGRHRLVNGRIES